ncbi:MAG: iron-containing alcohol dehydrogenase [Clostridia bacterium]|nr:iron-containing alcohol dehydrogenase [Clostridia bacterium]
MENSYYKRIVYKKNAFDDLKTYIKLNFLGKNILLVSTKSVPAENVTEVLNALFSGTENVAHFVSRNNFDIKEMDLLLDKLSKTNANLIVSLGGGRCCDVVKYFAHIHNIDYVVCPSVSTSLSYFCTYCFNPIEPTESFYSKLPNKIFIQESIIKNSSCLTNINGLCFLHSLRAILIDDLIYNKEKDKYVVAGLEKLCRKLDDEQTNILLCGEDSNLVLMDMLIDYGYFINQLDLDEFYLTNMYKLLSKISQRKDSFSGKKMLVCSTAILSLYKNYIQINSLKMLEKNNYFKVEKLLQKYKIGKKCIKNNVFFNNFAEKYHIKRDFLEKQQDLLREINQQIKSINNFGKCVKSIFKYGIEIEDDYQDVLNSLMLAPYIFLGSNLVNLISVSGVLNALTLD